MTQIAEAERGARLVAGAALVAAVEPVAGAEPEPVVEPEPVAEPEPAVEFAVELVAEVEPVAAAVGPGVAGAPAELAEAVAEAEERMSAEVAAAAAVAVVSAEGQLEIEVDRGTKLAEVHKVEHSSPAAVAVAEHTRSDQHSPEVAAAAAAVVVGDLGTVSQPEGTQVYRQEGRAMVHIPVAAGRSQADSSRRAEDQDHENQGGLGKRDFELCTKGGIVRRRLH